MIQKHAGLTILLCCLATLLTLTLTILPAQSGPYAVSAHGDATDGVSRTGVPFPPYVTGNCVHCHEQHASIGGDEPAPDNDAPSPYALFAGFNDAILTSYIQSDNFCFYCHTGSGSLQSGGISNEDYATTFGSSTVGSPTGIFEAFNQDTYHNLHDISVFSQTQFSYFTSDTNPCMACHNPHLAKRNREYPSNPTYAAISRPTDHDNLWGDDLLTERMSPSPAFNNDYQPPQLPPGSYEPGGTATADSSLTPNYNTFCGDCHDDGNTIPSTPLGRNLYYLDWSGSGDKHGANPATGDTSRDINDPYEVLYASQINYTLSCLDCHEPHGSKNSFLIRRAVNGMPPNADILFYATPPTNQDIITSAKGLITVTTTPTMDGLCKSCHNSSNSVIHHGSDDAPYIQKTCAFCHGAGGVDKILCEQCHFHGSRVFIPADESKSGVAETRRTF